MYMYQSYPARMRCVIITNADKRAYGHTPYLGAHFQHQAARLEHAHHLVADRVQHAHLKLVQFARYAIDGAQRAERESGIRGEKLSLNIQRERSEIEE